MSLAWTLVGPPGLVLSALWWEMSPEWWLADHYITSLLPYAGSVLEERDPPLCSPGDTHSLSPGVEG